MICLSRVRKQAHTCIYKCPFHFFPCCVVVYIQHTSSKTQKRNMEFPNPLLVNWLHYCILCGNQWLNSSTIAPTEKAWVQLRTRLKPVVRNQRIACRTLLMVTQTTRATLTCWAQSLLKQDLPVPPPPSLKSLVPHMAGLVRHHLALPAVRLVPRNHRARMELHYKTSKPALTPSEELCSDQAGPEGTW